MEEEEEVDKDAATVAADELTLELELELELKVELEPRVEFTLIPEFEFALLSTAELEVTVGTLDLAFLNSRLHIIS